jgi:hypothetical protein
MEMSSSECVDLDEASQVLAKSRAVRTLVKKFVGPARFSDALILMQSGTLQGDLGADLHDLLVDAIRNDAKEVWSGVISHPHDDYPIRVNEFHGVFWIWAMEYDPVGYFLSKQDAVTYACSNWDVNEGEH